MSNTIIVGDVAEGQKWFGEAEFLKQQLVNTYKNTNPNMSTWKQVTADVKIYVKMVNGVAQAFIYTEGGLFVTLEDFETPEPLDYKFYKDNIANPIKKKYKTGTTSYWYSTDKKECISWTWTSTYVSLTNGPRIDRGTSLIYVKGVEFVIEASLMCAAIRGGIIILLTCENRKFTLKTYKIIAGVLILQTGSSLLIPPVPTQLITRYHPNTFEFDEDISIVVFLKDVESAFAAAAFPNYAKVCKLSVSSDYVLVGETEVFGQEAAPTEVIGAGTTSAGLLDWTLTSNGVYTVTWTSQPSFLDRGTIITGKLVGRQYHYLYVTTSVNRVEHTTQHGLHGIDIGSISNPHSRGTPPLSFTYNATSSESNVAYLRVGIIDLDNPSNEPVRYTIFEDAYPNYVATSSYTTRYSYLETSEYSHNAQDIRYTVKAFYPKKKICLIHRRYIKEVLNQSFHRVILDNADVGPPDIFQTTSVTTIDNKLILFKNETVITPDLKIGLTLSEIHDLYQYNPTTIAFNTNTNTSTVTLSGIGAINTPGFFYTGAYDLRLSGTRVDWPNLAIQGGGDSPTQTQDIGVTYETDLNRAPLVRDIHFSENNKIIISSALTYQKTQDDRGVEDMLVDVVLDIDKNELVLQTSPLGNNAPIPGCSTTT